ncbi:MAG: iron ABC transporter [Methanoculleus sp. SDB]|nr:MAG: iron ABC transporter [Methanoculleus sp. SDB]
MKPRTVFTIAVLLVMMLVSVLITVTMGPTELSLQAILTDRTASMVFFDIRLPRVITAFLVGCGLAVAGTAMQGLFKNSMADPYIIGTSSGAALGAAVSIVLLGAKGLPIFAFIGATGATFTVYILATRKGRAPVETLLLTGVALSMFFSAFLSFLMYSAGNSLHQIIFWLMGGFWTVEWSDVRTALLILIGSLVLFVFSRDLNILSLGEEEAVHLGVNVERLKKILLLFSSFITGIAVSIAGAIGFIGLITPHIMRLIVGPDHRLLLPSAMIAGGLFLLWADTIARSFANEMPVGVITSFVGAPFFVYLLRRRMNA